MTAPATRTGGPAITPGVEWAEARAALERVVGGIPALFAEVPDPSAHAVGVWDIAELAVHMRHAWAVMPNLARRDVDAMLAQMPAIPGRELRTPGGSMLGGLHELAEATVAAVACDPERDLAVLGAWIRDAARRFLTEFDGAADPSHRPWIADGITGPPSLFACHLLNEMVVHSFDVARAAGLRPRVADRDAAVVVRGFILPMLVNLMRGVPGPRLAIDMRLAGDRRVVIVYTGDGVVLEEPSARPVDSHLWISPAALLLLMWKRRSLPAIVASRQALVWGRRPWTALEPLKAAPKV